MNNSLPYPLSDPTRYILYIRKSTDSSDKQVQSLDDQILVMSELANRRGLLIFETIVESKSAKMPDSRDGFRKMIALIKKGEMDGILTYAFDRLSRNPVDSASIKWLLQTEKIKRIVTSGRDYLPEDNALLLSIEDGMANEYIRKLKKDIRRGMVSKFKKGVYPSMAPIGYFNCPYDRDIKPDKEYFPKIRKMWDMMLSGKYSVPEIHEIAVDQWHLVTPTRKKLGGTLISRSLVYKIFHNRFYTGEINWDGMVNQGIHKPMVTLHEFEAVQEMIKTKPRDHSPKHVHAYGGLMRCAVCNCQITPELQVKNGKKYTYYHCTGRSKYIPCSQIKKRISEKALALQFIQKLKRIEIDKDFYDIAIDYIKNQANAEKLEVSQNIDVYQKELTKAKLRKAKLTELLIEELIEKEEFKQRVDEVRQNIVRLNLKLSNAKLPRQVNYDDLYKKFGLMLDVEKVFKNLDKTKQKELIENLTSDIFLKDRKLTFEISPVIKPIQDFNDKYNQKGSKKEHSINPLVKSKPSHRKRNLDFSAIRSRWCNTIKLVCKLHKKHWYSQV